MVEDEVRERIREARTRRLRSESVRRMRNARSASEVTDVVLGALEEGLPGAAVRVALREGPADPNARSGESPVPASELERAATRLVLSGDTCAVLGAAGLASGATRDGEMIAAALWSEGERGVVVALRSGGFSPRELELLAGLADLASCFLQTLALAAKLSEAATYAAVGRNTALAAHDVAKQLWCVRSLAHRILADGSRARADAETIIEVAQSTAASMRAIAQAGTTLADRSTAAGIAVKQAVASAIARVRRIHSDAIFYTTLTHEASTLGLPPLGESILENLLDNAALASPPGETIRVAAQVDRANLMLRIENVSVEDPSPQVAGLSPEQPERLGVALTLSSELVASIGGRLEVREEARQFLAELRLPAVRSLT